MKMDFRLLKSLNWRNAAGQILVTALGVVLALAAADWNERRNRREFELTVLQEMHTSLVADLAELEGGAQRFRDLDLALTQLLALAEEKPPYDSATMDALFGAPISFRRVLLNSGGYESLKSLGIDLVRNSVLRRAITNVYEVEYRRLEDIAYIEENVLWEVARPYYLTHFRDLRFGLNATPLDYQQVINDPEYQNIVQYKLAAMQGNWVPTFVSAMTRINALVTILEVELKEAGVPLQQ